MLIRERKPSVVHVAALRDYEAFQTLCRTTQVLANKGMSQVLLSLDNGRGTDMTAAGVIAAETRSLRCIGLSIFGKIRALELELAHLFREKSLYAVHLHGLGPCLLGSRALNGNSLQVRVLYSPHLTHVRSWSTTLLSRLLQSQLSPLDNQSLADSLIEAQALSKLFNRSAEVLPPPVSDVFFAISRHEDMRLKVLATGFGVEAVDVVTRLCVLLNGREARVAFSWLGPAQGGMRAQLEAANVHVLDITGDEARAHWLSRASAYIHISPRSRVPLVLAQAMAVGVPCLVSDTLSHRALIRHGETGYMCTSERDFLEKLVLLLRDRAERKRIGEAARLEAERSFTLSHFENAVLRAYGIARSKALLRTGAALSTSSFAVLNERRSTGSAASCS